MRNIKLIIEYDGTEYCGWQAQKNALGIQTVIKHAIEKVTGEDVQVHGSGRTDAGVHALGQVAHFHTNSRVPGDRFKYALNRMLPKDIVIIDSEEVDMDFHARISAVGKTYKYVIWNSIRPSALLSKRAYHVPISLDIDAMIRATRLFVGEHDFAAFRAQGGSAKTSVRRIYSAEVRKISQIKMAQGELVEIELHGNGFLYNMVRIIAGTLVELGLGKRDEASIIEALEKGDRTLAGKTLPPHGLYLQEVYY